MIQNKTTHRILLMADSAEGDGADPFATAAANLEAPKFPILAPDRIVRFEIKKCTVDAVKDKPGRKVMTVKLATTKDATLDDGKIAKAGFTGFHRIGLTPSEPGGEGRERTNKNIAEDLGMLLKACGKGTNTPREVMDNPAMVEGQVVDMKVGVTPEKNGFPASNNFKFVLPG